MCGEVRSHVVCVRDCSYMYVQSLDVGASVAHVEHAGTPGVYQLMLELRSLHYCCVHSKLASSRYAFNSVTERHSSPLLCFTTAGRGQIGLDQNYCQRHIWLRDNTLQRPTIFPDGVNCFLPFTVAVTKFRSDLSERCGLRSWLVLDHLDPRRHV